MILTSTYVRRTRMNQWASWGHFKEKVSDEFNKISLRKRKIFSLHCINNVRCT